MKIFKIVLITIFVQLVIFGFLTRLDIIPNVFNIPFLQPSIEEYPCGPKGCPVAKPVIYLYPEKQQDILVKLDYEGGEIIADFPKIDQKIGGWSVVAFPDGGLMDKRDGQKYSYLFWEANDKTTKWNIDTGFIVPGDRAREFLVEKLSYLGLTPKEYNEFIVYWYPKMMKNKYNLVHFAQEQYTQKAKLTVIPKPDSLLRVFMVLKPLEEKIIVPKQELAPFTRKGFSVVEWGGVEI